MGASEKVDAVLSGRRCRDCGCTDDDACVIAVDVLTGEAVGCSWVEPSLCSACSPPTLDGLDRQERISRRPVLVAFGLVVAMIAVLFVAYRATGAVVDDCAARAEARSAFVGTPFRQWLHVAVPDPAWGAVRWHSDRVRDVQTCRWDTDVLRVRLLESGPQIRSWRWLRCDPADTCTVLERYPTP